MRFLFLLLFLSGCAPYAGYTHMSNPFINDDGFDMLCGGVKLRQAVEISAGACSNLHDGDDFLRFDIEYVWPEM